VWRQSKKTWCARKVEEEVSEYFSVEHWARLISVLEWLWSLGRVVGGKTHSGTSVWSEITCAVPGEQKRGDCRKYTTLGATRHYQVHCGAAAVHRMMHQCRSATVGRWATRSDWPMFLFYCDLGWEEPPVYCRMHLWRCKTQAHNSVAMIGEVRFGIEVNQVG